MSEKCRNCIHYDTSNKDGINSGKCYCDARDNYYYPDDKCSKFEKK